MLKFGINSHSVSRNCQGGKKMINHNKSYRMNVKMIYKRFSIVICLPARFVVKLQVCHENYSTGAVTHCESIDEYE